jgi:predicted phage terminase large subunit-like protein
VNGFDLLAFYSTLAKKSFKHFIKISKPDYSFNWHHLRLIEKLQDFADGKIKRLMVFMPPRHGKSELTSRRFPAWLLGRNPRAKIIATSYAAELASSFNRDVQRIIDEPKFRELFPETRLAGPSAKSGQSWLRNNDIFEIVGHGGFYRCAGVGGAITGLGGDFLIVDDPFKNYEEAKSPTIRRKVFEWYTSTLYTRQEKEAGILLIQTRWHEDDLAGMLLQMQAKGGEFADQWEVINFPAILDYPNPDDPRKLGEALWPEKYDSRWMQITKTSLGSFQFSALYQQNPTPDEGQFIRASWLREYPIPPDHFDRICISWDMTFGSERKTADFVVGAVYGKRGSAIYLLDRVRGQWDFPETIAQFKRLSEKYPTATAKLVEAKANGQAVIDSLKKEISGIIPIVPTSSKASRLAACQPFYEAGNVFYPEASRAPWIGQHIEELVGFPNVKNDDAVDAETQAIQWLTSGSLAKFSDTYLDFEPSGFDNGKINW